MSRKWLFLISPLKLALAVLISFYFWDNDTFVSIRRIPLWIIIAGLSYIGLQLITRRLMITGHWWDWIYYFGLLSIMIPVTFAQERNVSVWDFITDLGTCLLIIPAIIDLIFILFKLNKRAL